jgi:broad specificity phosphatase PhoE
VQQAESAAEYLRRRKIKPNLVFVSPALRTKETANIVCKQLQYDTASMITSADLQEIFQGDWEGQRRDELHTAEVLERMTQQGWEFKSPGPSQCEIQLKTFCFF